MQKPANWRYLGWIIASIILLLAPLFLGKYTIFLLSLLAIYALVALGLNLLMGYTGQIAAGHAGFLALGAYFTAIVGENLQWLPCPVILMLAGLFTGVIGFLLGIPITLSIGGLRFPSGQRIANSIALAEVDASRNVVSRELL